MSSASMVVYYTVSYTLGHIFEFFYNNNNNKTKTAKCHIIYIYLCHLDSYRIAKFFLAKSPLTAISMFQGSNLIPELL